MAKNSQSFRDLRRVSDFLGSRDPRPEIAYTGRYQGARLDDNLISWTPDPARPKVQRPPIVRLQRIPPDLYLRFAALAQAKDEEIVEFAGRWGPLMRPMAGSWEPISAWRTVTRLTQALLRGFYAIVMYNSPDPEDCRVINERAYPETPDLLKPNSDPVVLRSIIVRALNGWYNEPMMAQTLVELVGDQIQLRPSAVGLSSTILMQLAYVISNARPKLVCYACGRAFLPARRPTRGVRQYCSLKQCRQARQADASRDYRQRKKSAATAGRRNGNSTPEM